MSLSFQLKAIVSHHQGFFYSIENIFCFYIGPDCNKIAGSDLDGDQYFVNIIGFFFLRL